MSLRKNRFRMVEGSELNIMDFGAVGDGVADETQALQEALNARGSLSFPSGIFKTGALSTPSNPNNSGFKLEGAGKGLSDPESSVREITSTNLMFTGADGDVLLTSDSTLGLDISGIAFTGIGFSPSALYKVTYTNQGSGLGSIKSCRFAYSEAGVQMAEDIGDGTCADMFFESTSFTYCDAGLLVKNNQGLNYNFQSCSFGYCKSGIKMERGNSVAGNTLNFVDCGEEEINYSIEINAADTNAYHSVFNGVRLEQGCDNLFRGYGGAVSFNGFTEAQSASQYTLVDLHGTDFKMSNAIIKSPKVLNLYSNGGKVSSAIFENTWFNFDFDSIKDFMEFDINQKLYVSLKNCYKGFNKTKIQDLNTSVLLGPTVYECQTTDSNGKVAYLFGGGTQYPWNTIECVEGLNNVNMSVTGYDGTDVYFAEVQALVEKVGSTKTVLGFSVISESSNFSSISITSSTSGCKAFIGGIANKTIDWRLIATLN